MVQECKKALFGQLRIGCLIDIGVFYDTITEVEIRVVFLDNCHSKNIK